MTIDGWQIVQMGRADYRVMGHVEGEGAIRTSPIVAFEEHTKTVITRSGSRYVLGSPLNADRLVVRYGG